MSIRFLWLGKLIGCLCFSTEYITVPLTFPTFHYIQLTKNIWHIFLNVTIKPGLDLRCKHTQDSVNTVDISTDWEIQADAQRRQRLRTAKKK